MELIEELIHIYLMGEQSELSYVLDIRSNEILLDGDEAFTGEPEIDWDDEESDSYIVIPVATPPEMFDVMEGFSKMQMEDNAKTLLTVLQGKKPFSRFKDTAHELGIEKDWHDFEHNYAKSVVEEWIKTVK